MDGNNRLIKCPGLPRAEGFPRAGDFLLVLGKLVWLVTLVMRKVKT